MRLCERGALTAEHEHERGMFVLHLLVTQLCVLSFLRTPERETVVFAL